MNAFHLKVIALTTMIIDHLGAVFPEIFGFGFRVVGRVAFPIYVYLVAEGFRHTKSPKRFLLRLGIFALLSEPAFDVAIRGAEFPWGVDFFNHTNIFYTLFFGGAAIYLFQMVSAKINSWLGKALAVLPLLILMWLAESVVTSDYGAYGVAFIFIMYAIQGIKLRLAAMAVMCVWQHRTLVRHIIMYLRYDEIILVPGIFIMMIPATLIAVVLVAFYNGERGRSFKWFFYASYPVHLFVLGLLSIIF